MILQVIFIAFLFFFFLIWPSSKIGATNQTQRPIMIDITISFVLIIGRGQAPANEIVSRSYL